MYSVRSRLIKVVGEVLLGTSLLAITVVILGYLLAVTNQVNTAGGDADFILREQATIQTITHQMAGLSFDYVVFDVESEQVLSGSYQPEELKFYQRSFELSEPLERHNIIYSISRNTDLALVVREPLVPEFVYPPLRQVSFNTVSYLLFLGGEFVLLVWIIARLVRDFAYHFRLIQAISLNMGNPDVKVPRASATLSEFSEVLEMLYQKDDELIKLIEAERLQKKDLSFQVSALAHDVKTPLTVIKGNLELLDMTDVTEQQANFMRSINHSVAVFEKYFNAMMTYSRLLAEDRNYQEEIVISDFLTDLSLEIQDMMQTEGVVFELINHSEQKMVLGNRLNLERALTNILLNAAQHTLHDKHVKMTVSDSEKFLAFTIWNSGKPFSDQALKKANHLFFTEDNGRSGKHYGIGLSFAQGVAVRHQGQLILENPTTGGAQVTFLIRK